jgi:hypothetical protein
VPVVHVGFPRQRHDTNNADGTYSLSSDRHAITCHHPQAQPWINLANTYTANGDYGLALVALNVTPMAHETDHKMAEMPEPLRLHNNNEVRGMGPMAMAPGSIIAGQLHVSVSILI